MIYADTSFLFSLFLHDAHTAAVGRYLVRRARPLAFTAWQRCELQNAIRLAVFRGACSANAAKEALAAIEADLEAGNLVATPLAWVEVLERAERLSAAHTPTLGVRTLDLLHIAAAGSLRAKRFLTCNARQLTLAQVAGLPVDHI